MVVLLEATPKQTSSGLLAWPTEVGKWSTPHLGGVYIDLGVPEIESISVKRAVFRTIIIKLQVYSFEPMLL